VDPIACMITDRARLAGATDRERCAALVERVRVAAQRGVHLIQIRERDLDGGPLIDLVRQCLRAAASTRARILVNDRLDVALAAGAHGVHLRGESIPAGRARALAPRGFLMGRSVHDADEARGAWQAGGLDYLLLGTVFETASKRGRAAAGLDALRATVAATPLPVLAVGGLREDRIPAVMSTGAAGYAAIGMFLS
jgi:thiamine-phosphate pyrophosphorylase